MPPSFFDHPILNAPYAYPARHWELDESGQPTNRIVERRRPAQYVSPIPKPKKQKVDQQELAMADAFGLAAERQRYDPMPVINALRQSVDAWRARSPGRAAVLARARRWVQSLKPYLCETIRRHPPPFPNARPNTR
ncbi:MAG TPA: hypothetical protein VH988_24505 [Thermoanaerobaculia bacterium]|jgi:type III restriction enzyme|nr:hypothetical protein [Thermoanaerobaculia bacterium]